jgi:hypothetical protein
MAAVTEGRTEVPCSGNDPAGRRRAHVRFAVTRGNCLEITAVVSNDGDTLTGQTNDAGRIGDVVFHRRPAG